MMLFIPTRANLQAARLGSHLLGHKNYWQYGFLLHIQPLYRCSVNTFGKSFGGLAGHHDHHPVSHRIEKLLSKRSLCPSGDLLSARTRGLRRGSEPEWLVSHQLRQTALEENGAAGKTMTNKKIIRRPGRRKIHRIHKKLNIIYKSSLTLRKTQDIKVMQYR